MYFLDAVMTKNKKRGGGVTRKRNQRKFKLNLIGYFGLRVGLELANLAMRMGPVSSSTHS
jgi:hypothetical protein